MNERGRKILLVVVTGFAAFAVLSIYADVQKLGERIASYSWPTFAAAIGLALLNYVIRFARWELYLRVRNVRVPTGESALIFLSGFALSITPGKVGELVKSYLVRDTCGAPVASTASVVVAERVTDLLALLVLALAGVAAFPMARPMVIAGGIAMLLGLAILAMPRLAYWLIAVGTRPRPVARFAASLRLFYDGLADLVRPRLLVIATLMAMVAWLAECLGFAAIIGGFPGTDASLQIATLIYATTTLAGALSFLPGGLVVTEATMALFLIESARGVDEPTAAAATILTRLATLWFAVLLGLICLAALRRRLRQRHQAAS